VVSHHSQKRRERRTRAVPGHEFSGVIAAVAEDTVGFEIRQEVYGMNDWFSDGAMAEYCITQPNSVAQKPSRLTHVEAASVSIGALTAWQGLSDRAGLQAGQHVLVHGGAGAVGIFAIQLARFLGARVTAAGLLPIIEPEINIHCPEKGKAEELLKAAILEELEELPVGQLVMLKLTLPEQDDFYADCIRRPNVLRVVALSGGYSREEANARLRRNHGIVASFSRALVEGLSAQQSDAEFNAVLDGSIQSIFEASNT
jgi:hypothetical protein